MHCVVTLWAHRNISIINMSMLWLRSADWKNQTTWLVSKICQCCQYLMKTSNNRCCRFRKWRYTYLASYLWPMTLNDRIHLPLIILHHVKTKQQTASNEHQLYHIRCNWCCRNLQSDNILISFPSLVESLADCSIWCAKSITSITCFQIINL